MRQKIAGSAGQLAIALITILLLPAMAWAQDVTGPALKAAFIYNMAKFTEWPEEARTSDPFIMCVLDDPAVGDELVRAVRNRSLSGHSISVVRVTSTGVLRACHLMYVSSTAKQVAQIVAGLRSTPVLTISDLTGFTEVGGMVQVYFEHGRLRFTIGLESAQRARLQISAKILTLAIRK